MDEEERIAARNLVICYPQWDGRVLERRNVGTGWRLTRRQNEEIRWLNEGKPPASNGAKHLVLHEEATGFSLCPNCGRMLEEAEDETKSKTRKRPNQWKRNDDPYGHAEQCAQAGQPPVPGAIVTYQKAEVLRLEAWLPAQMNDRDVLVWGHSLGAALLIGIRHRYLLDGNEMEFVLEGAWQESHERGPYRRMALAFVDPTLGGSGYLSKVAREFHQVAKRALEHLQHTNCEQACYRCLKSYRNQRQHEFLSWPRIVPDLEQLAQTAPEQLPTEVGDKQDPGPWLEAYAAGVGSPLELKFLRLFEAQGFHPEKQVPVAPGGASIPISTADFAVPARRLAIYVDGAAFHIGSNLRRDRYIREKLQQGPNPWRVRALTAADLGRGAALVREIIA